jgi:hypothetical protein
MLGDYQVAFWTAGLLCVVAGVSFLTIGRSLRPAPVPAVATTRRDDGVIFRLRRG